MYLWEHRENLDLDINIKGYLYNYVRTRCISYLRKRKSMLKARDELYKKVMASRVQYQHPLQRGAGQKTLRRGAHRDLPARVVPDASPGTPGFPCKPTGQYDLSGDSRKIEFDRPPCHHGDPTGQFFAPQTLERPSNGNSCRPLMVVTGISP